MNTPQIPFNRSARPASAQSYLAEALASHSLAGDGAFTQKCHQFFKKRYAFPKSLLTTSCTHSLEMAALLADIQPGDEVIMPSYTFVSTANPFILRGAKVIFADSEEGHPNLDVNHANSLITPRTKAIVPVHYGGVACNMDALQAICQKHNLWLIEDAAQGINAYYKNQPLGGIGPLGCLSFHDTKNISSGEGGLLVVNHPQLQHRAEVVREKGTNRAAFFRGEVDKYGWVAPGSSYLPSELLAAYLWSQLEILDQLQAKRMQLWQRYQAQLQTLEQRGWAQLPQIPAYARHNAHIFFLVLPSLKQRNHFIQFLKAQGITAVFHYQALHQSRFFKSQYEGDPLPHSVKYTEQLVRLPLYSDLREAEQDYVIEQVLNFFQQGLHEA